MAEVPAQFHGQPAAMASQQKSLFSFFGGPKSGSANPTVKCATQPSQRSHHPPCLSLLPAGGRLSHGVACSAQALRAALADDARGGGSLGRLAQARRRRIALSDFISVII